eukprot:29565-Pelagococcus_subviridis.AAC.5
MMFECGDRRRNAWISRRLFTWSNESKWFFMHLIATYFPFLMHCALSTSEKVPSPFFATRRYSERAGDGAGQARRARISRRVRRRPLARVHDIDEANVDVDSSAAVSRDRDRPRTTDYGGRGRRASHVRHLVLKRQQRSRFGGGERARGRTVHRVSSAPALSKGASYPRAVSSRRPPIA